MITALLIAQQLNIDPEFTLNPESAFGGVILLLVLTLILNGKLRLEREVAAKERVIEIHETTIDRQQNTINTLTAQNSDTLKVIKELRQSAENEQQR